MNTVIPRKLRYYSNGLHDRELTTILKEEITCFLQGHDCYDNTYDTPECGRCHRKLDALTPTIGTNTLHSFADRT